MFLRFSQCTIIFSTIFLMLILLSWFWANIIYTFMFPLFMVSNLSKKFWILFVAYIPKDIYNFIFYHKSNTKNFSYSSKMRQFFITMYNIIIILSYPLNKYLIPFWGEQKKILGIIIIQIWNYGYMQPNSFMIDHI